MKRAISSTYKEKERRELMLSEYALQMVYETEDVSLLEDYDYYHYDLTDYSPSFFFTALGYCIFKSSFKWRLKLGSMGTKAGETSQYMQSMEIVQLLTQSLSTQQTPHYSIDELISIICSQRAVLKPSSLQ